MDFLFVLRVHPNLKFLKNTQNENIKKLVNNSNLIIIYPEEKLSSYELIRLSETIITFGSTIGIESTYMGKKSILIGDQESDMLLAKKSKIKNRILVSKDVNIYKKFLKIFKSINSR